MVPMSPDNRVVFNFGKKKRERAGVTVGGHVA